MNMRCVDSEWEMGDLTLYSKVEQRLKYLGFPAFGRNMQGAPDTRVTGNKWIGTPKEFKVDGTFAAEEETALRAFYGATHYTQYYGDGSTSSGNNGFQTTPASQDAKRVSNIEQNANNLAWLNAYNAPHWQNAYTTLNIPHSGQNANFKDGTDVTEENYAVSWTVDLLKAWQISFAQQGLTNTRLSINGFSDPTFRFGTHNRGGHSVGMSIDLGVNDFINRDNQNRTNDNNLANPTITATGWSIANAIQWSNLLNSGVNATVDVRNDQGGALKNFLSIYATTMRDAIPNNGTLEELAPSIVNGQEVLPALFGTGNQSVTALIQNAWIGG